MKRPPLALALAALLSGCGDAPSAAPSDTLPTAIVRVAEASALPPAAPLIGKARAARQAVLVARVPGSVVALEPLGALLAAGRPPVTLAAPELSARLAAARSEAARLAADLAREERLLKEGAAAPEVVRSLRQQAAAAAAAEAEAEAMAAMLAPAAPFDGRVLRSPLRVGDTVAPGMVLAEVASDGDLVVEVEVPLAFPSAPSGTLIRVSADGRSAEARLAELAPAAAAGARVRPARLELPASAGFLPGEGLRVDWPGVGSPRVTVPAAAVRRRSQLEQVVVVREGRSEVRLVRTAGPAGEGRVAVTSGLAGGEFVVVGSDAELRDGQPLEVRR